MYGKDVTLHYKDSIATHSQSNVRSLWVMWSRPYTAAPPLSNVSYLESWKHNHGVDSPHIAWSFSHHPSGGGTSEVPIPPVELLRLNIISLNRLAGDYGAKFTCKI